MEVKCIFEARGWQNHHFQVCDMINEYEDGAEMGFRAIRKRFSFWDIFWPILTNKGILSQIHILLGVLINV